MNLFQQIKPALLPEKITEGIDYIIENGLLVFTASYLEKRGFCCQNGCRNCPYGFTISTKPTNENGDNPAAETIQG